MDNRPAREFEGKEELIQCLKSKKRKITTWLGRRIDSVVEIARDSVGTNSRLPTGGLELFRQWASDTLSSKETIKQLKGIRTQTEFDCWVEKQSQELQDHWRGRLGETAGYGTFRKLTNLLLKSFILWNDLDDKTRQRLTSYLHVAPDKFTLAALRKCLPQLKIRKGASKGDITDKGMYDELQTYVRAITSEAGVQAIFFDILVWDILPNEPAK